MDMTSDEADAWRLHLELNGRTRRSTAPLLPGLFTKQQAEADKKAVKSRKRRSREDDEEGDSDSHGLSSAAGRGQDDEERPSSTKKQTGGKKSKQRVRDEDEDVEERGEEEDRTTFDTPFSAAAASASLIVRDRVQSISSLGDKKGMIKCFYAGIRWGVLISSERLVKGGRSELAAVLNEALMGEIQSFGQGEVLSITFLSGKGDTTEFPARSNKDSKTRWKAAMKKCSSIYIKRE